MSRLTSENTQRQSEAATNWQSKFTGRRGSGEGGRRAAGVDGGGGGGGGVGGGGGGREVGVRGNGYVCLPGV